MAAARNPSELRVRNCRRDPGMVNFLSVKVRWECKSSVAVEAGLIRSGLASPRDAAGTNVIFKITRDEAVHVERCSFALVDSVRAVGIVHEVERLAQVDKSVDEQLCSLKVNIVIAGAMHDEQVAGKALRKVDGGTIVVALLVQVGKAHVAFLVDGVVVALVGHGRHGDAG